MSIVGNKFIYTIPNPPLKASDFPMTVAGIEIRYCGDVEIRDNILRGVKGSSIWIDSTINATISGNIVDNATTYTYTPPGLRERVYPGTGIFVYNTTGETVIANNTIMHNEERGIEIRGSRSIELVGNTIVDNNRVGAYILSVENLLVKWNIIGYNGRGLELGEIGNASIWLNSFINNTEQVHINGSLILSWDNGSLGNYWSDYKGSDSNGDGIGDEPYVIDDANIDRHPLLPRAMIDDIGVTEHDNNMATIVIDATIQQPPAQWVITARMDNREHIVLYNNTITNIPAHLHIVVNLPKSQYYNVSVKTLGTSIVETKISLKETMGQTNGEQVNETTTTPVKPGEEHTDTQNSGGTGTSTQSSKTSGTEAEEVHGGGSQGSNISSSYIILPVILLAVAIAVIVLYIIKRH